MVCHAGVLLITITALPIVIRSTRHVVVHLLISMVHYNIVCCVVNVTFNIAVHHSAQLHDPPHNGTCYGPNVPTAGSVSSVTRKHNSSRRNQGSPRRVPRRLTDPVQSEFCMFDDNNCFERTKHDIKRENGPEIQRRNVIYGTQKNTRLITTKTDMKHSNCYLFVHHLPRKTTVGEVKECFVLS